MIVWTVNRGLLFRSAGFRSLCMYVYCPKENKIHFITLPAFEQKRDGSNVVHARAVSKTA